LRWHDDGRNELKKDGKFRHPADAAQWGNINNHFPWFDEDVRSIRFAMITDGKKKKANRGAPVRVAWYFCIIHRLRRWFTT
jgi:hypothetical protein